MNLSIWISFIIYTFTTAITPGPNNILALSATSNYGFKKSKKLLFGIYCGFFSVMIVCAIFSKLFIDLLPSITKYMKYIGGIYIIWLAIHIAKSKPREDNFISEEKTISFFQGFYLQFLNVKIIFFGCMAFISYIYPYYESTLVYVGFAFLVAIIANFCTMLWAIAGAAFSNIFKKYWKTTNYIMAGFLIYSAISLVFAG